MKSLTVTTSLLIAFICISPACKKEVGSSSEAKIAYSVNGLAQTSLPNSAAVQVANGLMHFTAEDSVENILQFFIQSDLAVNSFPLDSNGLHGGLYVDVASGWIPRDSYHSTWIRQSGSAFVIESINQTAKTVNGRFDFTGQFHFIGLKSPKEITNGIFSDVPYQLFAPSSQSEASFTVNGTAVQAKRVSTHVSDGRLQIAIAKQQGFEQLWFDVEQDIAVGVHSLDFFNANQSSDYTVRYFSDANTYHVAETGTITITEHDKSSKRLKGKFTFDTVNLLETGVKNQIKNGQFEVFY
jgi:Family of unknown function (DUF6252)